MKAYRSMIGLELVIPLVLVFGGLFYLFTALGMWSGLGFVAATAVFVGYTLFNTLYIIHGTSLRIRSGLLYDETIEIPTINSIKDIHNAISSPAASLDRMEIRYNGLNTVLVSPKDKKEFLAHLNRINPSIDISVNHQ